MNEQSKRVLDLMNKISDEEGHSTHLLNCLVCRRLFVTEIPELITKLAEVENVIKLLVEGIKTRNDIMRKHGEEKLIRWIDSSDTPKGS